MVYSFCFSPVRKNRSRSGVISRVCAFSSNQGRSSRKRTS